MLELEHVTAGYDGVPVVHAVSMTVADSECVALLGLNGAGKSTLLRSIVGLHPVAGGRVLFGGRDVTRQPSHRRLREGIAFVAESRELFAALTVEENLRAALVNERLSGSAQRERVEEATRPFPILGERLRQAAGFLSGGQQQMLAIARALITRPRLLILDEPSLGLAPVLVAEIYARMREMRSLGMSMLIVEQHVNEVMSLCDRLYVLDMGRVTHEGAPGEFVDNEEFARAYVGG